MSLNYNNPALEAELAYRRERLAAAVSTGRRLRLRPRRRQGGSVTARG